MKLALIGISVVLLNVPFGYWRRNVSRFSGQWLLAIHIPVLIIIAERLFTNLGFNWVSYPVFIAAFILGQWLGARIHKYLKEDKDYKVTSCMFVDFYNYFSEES